MAQFAEPHLQHALDAVLTAGAEARDARAAANVRLVAALYEQVAASRFEEMADAFTDDVEMEVVGPPGSPMLGSARGPAGVVERVRQNFALVEDQTPRILSIAADDDGVTVTGREEGRVRATGRRYAMGWVHRFTVRGDRIARFHEVLDPVDLLPADGTDAA
jgi:ketosteroid isomerase-like protein